MSNIVGLINYTKDISHSIDFTENIKQNFLKGGKIDNTIYSEKNILLQTINFKNTESNPLMTFKYNDCNYSIIHSSAIYNYLEIKKELEELGMSFISNSDTEILLKGYIIWGKNILNKINGLFSFAIWNSKTEELFLARDHMGAKSLYYTLSYDNFIFSTEIKYILSHNNVESIIDQNGFKELIGLGPAHTPGVTVFKNIYEIKPGHFGIFNKKGFYTEKYWYLKNKEHTDNFNTTCDTIKYLLEDAINRELTYSLNNSKNIGCMLSGGLDSSIISYYTNQFFNKHNLGQLKTYSIDYEDNDKNFIKNDFQPESDTHYINIMQKKLNSNHIDFIINSEELADFLHEAMIARDFPGMADIDSSMFIFCKKISSNAKVILSGECADEVFGGYPWFFNEKMLNSKTFPWSNFLETRQKLLDPDLFYNINLKEYVDYRYNESLEELFKNEHLNRTNDNMNLFNITRKNTFHLTYYWFMQNLLNRADKIATYNNLEIRVPFCDYRIIEYLWNIPWEIKTYNNREKGLLRYIVKDILPEDIIFRKKSPYPKTYNPNYLNKVINLLTDILKNNNSPINNILNKTFIKEILETKGKNIINPWFGQLMTGPQLIAYLIQLNDWLDTYKPKIQF